MSWQTIRAKLVKLSPIRSSPPPAAYDIFAGGKRIAEIPASEYNSISQGLWLDYRNRQILFHIGQAFGSLWWFISTTIKVCVAVPTLYLIVVAWRSPELLAHSLEIASLRQLLIVTPVLGAMAALLVCMFADRPSPTSPYDAALEREIRSRFDIPEYQRVKVFPDFWRIRREFTEHLRRSER